MRSFACVVVLAVLCGLAMPQCGAFVAAESGPAASAPQQAEEPAFVETESKEKRMSMFQALAAGAGLSVVMGKTPKALKISALDEECVMCQYLTQRIRGEMMISGIGGGVPFGMPPSDTVPPPYNPGFDAESSSLQNGASGAGSAGGESGSGEATSFVQVGEKAQTKAQTNSKRFINALRGIKNKVMGHLNGPQMPLSKREQQLAMIPVRPKERRFSNLFSAPYRAQERARERFYNAQLYQSVYTAFERICTTRFPQVYLKHCQTAAKNYQEIGEGLKWKDSPATICMATQMCKPTSYLARGPHVMVRKY